jgi:hypothetical protein
MTDSNKKKQAPREFWIDDVLNVHRPYQRTAYLHQQDADDKGSIIIHVIEYSALEELQKERDKLRAEVERLKEENLKAKQDWFVFNEELKIRNVEIKKLRAALKGKGEK